MSEVSKKSVLIGYKLKQLRLSKGYTQTKIAEVLGVSPQHYGTLERGINSFSLDNILKLCDFYNVTIMSILGELRKVDRKRKKECEKLVNQIQELGEEHQEVVSHMVAYYRQLERKSMNQNIIMNKNNKRFNLSQEDENLEDEELQELIENLEQEIKQQEGLTNRKSRENYKKKSNKKKKSKTVTQEQKNDKMFEQFKKEKDKIIEKQEKE